LVSLSQQLYVTLEDVARHAQVSLATASRVLNGGTRVVREDLRRRVLAAANELQYIPNAHAQALARATSSTVGVITHDVSDPYFAAIAGGVMRVATEHGLLVMLASTFRDPEREISYVSALRAQRARAILLAGSGFETPQYSRAMAAELTPYRRTGGRVAVVSHHDLQVDAVVPQNREGAGDLARALIDLGHREFAVISGPAVLTTVTHRLAGFRDALADAGIALPDEAVVDGTFTRDGGYEAATELVKRGMRATAIFALSDVMAIGALSALRDSGVDVPGEVSLAGFDDIPIVRDLVPALTTVRLPLEQIGERAMSLALDERVSQRRRIERITGEVVLRASTAPPRR
jgi:LacI family transcriptional regulator, galactose operon repressor